MDNDNKLYAIIMGSYSDWQLLGYVVGQKQAIDYCASVNYHLDADGNITEIDDYNNVYYIPMIELSSDSTQTPTFLYQYSVWFSKVDGTYVPKPKEAHENQERFAEITATLPTSVLNRSIDFFDSKKFARVIFTRASYIEDDRAKKIAQDILAEELYKKACEE